MELKEMIKVMQHYENGGEVELREKESSRDWRKNHRPLWNFDYYEYRIKPKVTIEKWLCRDIDSGEHFIMESSDVNLTLKDFPKWIKVKFLESYEVEL